MSEAICVAVIVFAAISFAVILFAFTSRLPELSSSTAPVKSRTAVVWPVICPLLWLIFPNTLTFPFVESIIGVPPGKLSGPAGLVWEKVSWFIVNWSSLFLVTERFVPPVTVTLSVVVSVFVRVIAGLLLSPPVWLIVMVWSAFAPESIAFSFVWSASVNTFESVALSTSALISAAVWSAVAPASIPSNLLWSAVVKFSSVWDATEKSIVPSPSWYVTVIPDSVLLDTIAPTISCICSVVWFTSAPASIALSLVWSASVNTFESEALSTSVLISAAVWSAVALASIAFNLLWSASVKTFESEALSTSALISEAVWSAVAPASIPSSLLWSALVKFSSVCDATEKSIVPSLSWYVTVIPDSVFPDTIAPTISCISSLVWSAVAPASIPSSLFLRVVVKFSCVGLEGSVTVFVSILVTCPRLIVRPLIAVNVPAKEGEALAEVELVLILSWLIVIFEALDWFVVKFPPVTKSVPAIIPTWTLFTAPLSGRVVFLVVTPVICPCESDVILSTRVTLAPWEGVVFVVVLLRVILSWIIVISTSLAEFVPKERGSLSLIEIGAVGVNVIVELFTDCVAGSVNVFVATPVTCPCESRVTELTASKVPPLIDSVGVEFDTETSAWVIVAVDPLAATSSLVEKFSVPAEAASVVPLSLTVIVAFISALPPEIVTPDKVPPVIVPKLALMSLKFETLISVSVTAFAAIFALLIASSAIWAVSTLPSAKTLGAFLTSPSVFAYGIKLKELSEDFLNALAIIQSLI